MTFAEKLSHVAKDDPKFAKSVKRIRVASWIFGVAVVVALGFALWSLKIGFSNQTQITKIESPCLKYGAKSEQCKESFEQAVLTITHPEACAILRKSGLEIEPCAHARLRQEIRRGRERARTSRATRGGDAIHQPSHKGHQQPSPSLSGDGGIGTGAGKGGQTGGHEGGHAQGHPGEQNQAQTSPAPTSQADSGSASADTQADIPRDIPTPAPTPESHPLPETVEAAGGAVGKTAEAAQGVVEGVGETGCKLVACR